jgi:hypothetical protein
MVREPPQKGIVKILYQSSYHVSQNTRRAKDGDYYGT